VSIRLAAVKSVANKKPEASAFVLLAGMGVLVPIIFSTSFLCWSLLADLLGSVSRPLLAGGSISLLSVLTSCGSCPLLNRGYRDELHLVGLVHRFSLSHAHDGSIPTRHHDAI
jgi:hypothetical protein